MGDVLDAALGADFAFVQQDQIVAWADFIGEMRGPENREAGGRKIVDVVGDREAGACVKADGGFIEQQKRGAMDQRAGDFHASAMAAIERAEFLVDAFKHAQTGEGILYSGLRDRAGQPVQRREIPHVRAHGGIEIQSGLLKYNADLRQRFLAGAVDAISADLDDPGRGPDEPCERRDQRGFARAIWAKKGSEPPLSHGKGHISQGRFCAPRVAQPVHAQGGFVVIGKGGGGVIQP